MAKTKMHPVDIPDGAKGPGQTTWTEFLSRDDRYKEMIDWCRDIVGPGSQQHDGRRFYNWSVRSCSQISKIDNRLTWQYYWRFYFKQPEHATLFALTFG